MPALYDLFRSPQSKGEKKVRYHARSVVTAKTSTRDLIRTITQRSAFKEHDYITTKEIQYLCGLSNATALRRLKERVKERKLTYPGHLRAPFYFPVPGNYGVSRERSVE